jgi:hypothetical protein
MARLAAIFRRYPHHGRAYCEEEDFNLLFTLNAADTAASGRIIQILHASAHGRPPAWPVVWISPVRMLFCGWD